MLTKLHKSTKIGLVVIFLITGFIIFSQTAVGQKLNLPNDIVQTVWNFIVPTDPDFKACDYKDGMILLVKPVATGVGEGRYEAGDIVEIRDGTKLCNQFGDRNPLSRLETVKLLPLYYPAKLTKGQIADLMSSEVVTEREVVEGEEIEFEKTLKMRKKGIDYTTILNANEIEKVSKLEDIKRLPVIDLNIIKEKKSDQKAVVSMADYVPPEKTNWQKFVDIMRPTAYALTATVVTVDTGGTGDYASLNAAVVAEARDLTVSDEQLTFECEASDGTADTTSVDVTGYTTNSTHYIKIWTNPAGSDRHDGVWDDTKYRLINTDSVSYTRVLNVGANTDYTKIIGLQMGVDSNATYWSNGVLFSYGSASPIFSHNILKGIYKAGVGVEIPDYSDALVYNNIIYGFNYNSNAYGIKVGKTTSSSYGYYYNNTLYNNYYGMAASNIGAYSIAKNNISFNNTNIDYDIDWSASSDRNVSSDATAVGTTVATGLTSYGDYFEDYINKDFHLKGTGLSLFGISGEDLSGTFTDDVDGDTRSAWDIGADEYVAGGGETPTAGASADKVLKGGAIFKSGVIFRE
ncbi:MAG: hypothetical protein GX627_03180 [Parcubacteria group bacterium]|nr:hypothetical protein [Parcubacteria group bacterium]